MFGNLERDIRIDELNSKTFDLKVRAELAAEDIKALKTNNKQLHDKVNTLVKYLELDPIYRNTGYPRRERVTGFRKISKWKRELCKKWHLCDKA